jgi:Zn-dependent peptidase ImmA (M78 family)/transcriptional regulator with XRE-family HTH domain
VKPGTPGFVGSRLREAREVRGLTAVTLAEIVEISPQAISQYEAGKSTPSPEVLHLLASAVNLPEHFFMRPQRPTEGGAVFYRSMSSATKGARARAERRFEWLQDIVRYLTEFVTFPDSNFPRLDIPGDPLLLSDAEIEDAADEVRRYWGMHDGPIANMVLLLENQGAIVARDNLGADALDSLSEFVSEEGRPYIIVGTDKGSAVRWRFDLAHELGHVVLHGGLSPDQLLRPEYHKRIEEQAHRFASAFLLPLAPFGEDLFSANLDVLRSLKLKWRVSIGMMVTRARQCDLISEETARRLWINLSRRGWRRVEPYDREMEPEMPRLLRRSIELVLDEGVQTADDLLVNLALPGADVESLSCLPAGYLRNFSRVSLAQRSSTERTSSRGEIPTNVIRLTRRS